MTIKEIRAKYKIWALLIRAIVFALPVLFMKIGEVAEKVGYWLDKNILPNPQKRVDKSIKT